MQDNFGPCLAFTLKFEGGKVDDPRDPGGRTNEGVTQTTYNAFRKARGQPVGSVYNMTADDRDAIYQSGYWNQVGASALPHGADLATFDYGVNSGPARARKAVPSDRTDPAVMVKRICASRTSFLHLLRDWSVFGRGWSKRVAACEALGVKMALQKGKGESPEIVRTDLDLNAGKAKDKASTAKTTATATATANAAPAAATGHVSLWVVLAIVAVLVIVTVYFVLRAAHHGDRAEAYSNLAKGG